MSISPALCAARRSAYRDVLRASSLTFHGDAPILQAFRAKMRAISQQYGADPETFQKQSSFLSEVAGVLRKNIVQGEKLSKEDGAVYRIRMTKHTELGNNSTVKSLPPLESSRSVRRRSQLGSQTTFLDAALPDGSTSSGISSGLPKNFSALKRAHVNRTVPELLESDLEEAFVRGSGPGGQSVNKTENNVQLLHKPTGIRVSCQETRSLAQNRKIARKLLLQKLDKISNPGLSKEEMKAAKQRERERQRKKKARRKAERNEEQDLQFERTNKTT